MLSNGMKDGSSSEAKIKNACPSQVAVYELLKDYQ